MKVELISETSSPIQTMYRAARNCYSADGPITLWDKYTKSKDLGSEEEKKMWTLVKNILGSGHESIAEFVNFTFAIENVDRALMAQLTRHRIGVVFTVQSQRYVEIKESKSDLVKLLDMHDKSEIFTVVDKYFVVNRDDEALQHVCLIALINYRDLIENQGLKAEDARTVLPNCTKTNIVMSVNLRELSHICGLRLCSKAQAPIRKMTGMLVREVTKKYPEFKELLVPKCKKVGFCMESKSCGLQPKLSEIKGE